MAEKISVDLTSLGLESDSYKITVTAKSPSYATSEAGLLSVDARYGLFDAQGKLVATWDNLVDSYSIRMQYEPELDYIDRGYFEDETGIVSASTHPKTIIDTVYNNTAIVIIPDNITAIPRYAFWNMTSLTKIIIPKSIVKIGDNAFKGCTNLSEICYNGTIEDWCKINFASAGSNPCFESSAQTIKIKDTDTSYYTAITGLVIPNTISAIPAYAFFGFDGLSSIILPETLRSVGRAAFHLNKYGKAHTLQRSGKTKLDIFFQGPIALWTDIKFKDPTANPQFLGHLHIYESSGSTSYISVNEDIGIDLCNTDADVVNIGKYQFTDAGTIPSLKLPRTLERVEEHAFYACNTENIEFSGTVADWCNIRFLDRYANPLLNNRTNGTVGDAPSIVFENPDGYICSFNNVLAIPEGVQCIHNAQFAHFNTKKIIFPSTLQAIRNHAFAFCYNADTYDFRYVKQVPKLSDTFKLVSKSDYDGLHGRRYTTVFQGIVDYVERRPKQILVPASLYSEYRANTTWAALDDYHEDVTQEPLLVASDVEEATSITIATDDHTYFELYEDYLPGLEIVDWGDGTITTVDAGGIHAHHYPAYGTYTIKLYGVTEIRRDAFNPVETCLENSRILSAYINPEVTAIQDRAFAGCSNLASITLTEGLTRIGDSAFDRCDALTFLYIPSTVTYIGAYLCNNNGIAEVDFGDPQGWGNEKSGSDAIDSSILDDDSNAAYYLNQYSTLSLEKLYNVVAATLPVSGVTSEHGLLAKPDENSLETTYIYPASGSFTAPGEILSASISALIGVNAGVSFSGNTISWTINGLEASKIVKGSVKYTYKMDI